MIAIQLMCDLCGRRTKEVVFDGSAPRGEIEKLRTLDGWERFRPRNTASNQDWCRACAEEFFTARRAGERPVAK